MALKKLSQTFRVCIALLLSVFSTNILPVAVAHAAQDDTPKKVFVCKYVGTPGVDERLQTGNNPINVSINAIQNNQWDGTVPGYFSDAHDRSYVLAYDIGQAEPSVDQCPAPQGPTTIPVPSVPVDDPCGLANATYGTVPTGNYIVQVNPDGSITLTANSGYLFTGSLSQVTLPAPTDSGTLCEVEPTIIPVPSVPTIDPCGSENAIYGSVPDGNYSVQVNQDGSITLTTNDGYLFTGGLSEVTLPAPVDLNEACPVDVCPNIPELQVRVPQGMRIDDEGDCVDKKITICHATSAVVNPYNKISVSTNAADGVAGNSGGQADHFAEHTGPIFDPLTNVNGDDWGDIIPPIADVHNGLNWTTQGQAIYDNGDCIYVPPTDSCPLVPGIQTDTTLCTPGQGGGGQTLGTSTTASTPAQTSAATLPASLPATGGGTTNLLAIVLSMLTAYGAVYFLQGRRNIALSSSEK